MRTNYRSCTPCGAFAAGRRDSCPPQGTESACKQKSQSCIPERSQTENEQRPASHANPDSDDPESIDAHALECALCPTIRLSCMVQIL